jgi:hypothetical protein
MKKLFLLVAIMAMTVAAKAQHEEGDFTIQPRVGVTFATMTGEDDAKMKTNLTYGLEFERFFTDEFSVAAGILFSNLGFKTSVFTVNNVENKVTLNNYYGLIPITLNYYVVEGLAIKAGVQPSFRVKTQIKEGDTKLDLDNALDMYFGNEASINRFDLAIPVGLSYEFRRITVDARYNFGLVKVFKGTKNNYFNRYISLTLGYKF